MKAPDHVEDQLSWVLLMSGHFAGTTLTELREKWTAPDVFDALDMLSYQRAMEKAAHKQAEQKAARGRR